jgi:octaprenyl-diphosphate synthase
LELSEICNPIQAGLDEVEVRLRTLSNVDFTQLSELLEYSLQGTGKRIRPVLTFLAGKFYNYDIKRLLPMATAVEVMHTATLIHDDAIDNSQMRRGQPTVYNIWGTDKAVLLGDYLFAEAGALTATTENIRVIKQFAETLKTISSGELNQAFNSFNLNQTRQEYIDRIARKTASLFSMSTESGAVLSDAPEESIQILISYGHNLGIAFQIVDDILDFTGTEQELGKPMGSDLSQGTLTLPSMLLLEYYPEDNPVRELFETREEGNNIKKAIEMIRNSSIIQECYRSALDYCDLACRDLNLLPDKASRQILLDLAEFITSRNK